MFTDSTGYLPEWLEDTSRFIGGACIALIAGTVTVMTSQMLLIPGASSIPLFTMNMAAYGAMLMVSSLNKEIKRDMEKINWNPYNSDVNAVADSKSISFYKGVFVFRYGNSGGSAFSYGVIGLGRGASINTVRHEYGHHKQQRLMGLAIYTPIAAIPSLISAANSAYNVHANRWYERWATDWGNRGLLWF
ncbi:MAG: hypothetical protein K9L64_03980 [Candidatus Izimaplasma sp.]|nr:hypothetical protein [Candidatus Izimaplasma bacterium]